MDFSDVTPVQRLALAYARSDVKAAWGLLLALDSRLADVVLTSSEPLIGQMKLAWWRDAILTSKDERPKGEPMLSLLSQYEDDAVSSGLATAMVTLVDGWSELLANEIWTPEVLDSHARQRGQAVFGTYLVLAGMAERAEAGKSWALDDLSARSGQANLAHNIDRGLPRPLSILAMSARQQRAPKKLSGLRLIFHGLTGL